MTDLSKYDIIFELSVCENLLLVEKMKKMGLVVLFLGASKLQDYQKYFENEP